MAVLRPDLGVYVIFGKFVIHFPVIICRWRLRRSLSLSRFFLSAKNWHVFEPFDRFNLMHRLFLPLNVVFTRLFADSVDHTVQRSQTGFFQEFCRLHLKSSVLVAT
jgi:hypothetical protein